MNANLELAIKSQEAIVITRSLEITQALNAKRYGSKHDADLIAKLTREIEDAQVRHSLACADLTALYIYRNSIETVEVA